MKKEHLLLYVFKYNGCCAGLRNIKNSKALNIHSLYMYINTQYVDDVLLGLGTVWTGW
jgi:hypothetical protein